MNDARINLENNEIKITDLQFCFILIKALPESYSTVTSTILATGEPKSLSPKTIQDRILNEEGWCSRASASLNKVAPIKQHGNKSDKSKVKCFYCNKPGHKHNECWKKKKDNAEKDKKEKDKGKTTLGTKAVNAHISTVDDNEDLPVSLYAATRSRWMVDSGAMHHITLHHSNFIRWSPAQGVVSLGGHAEITQIGTGTVAIHPSRGDKVVHLQNVMHVDKRYIRQDAESRLTRPEDTGPGGTREEEKSAITSIGRNSETSLDSWDEGIAEFSKRKQRSNPQTRAEDVKSLDGQKQNKTVDIYGIMKAEA